MPESKMPQSIQIASLIVHTQPELLETVKANLLRLPHLEVHQQSPMGKLVVVLEAEHEASILDNLNTIQNLPGVLNAVLVYHEIVESPEAPQIEPEPALAQVGGAR
ncbi:chaperone NapD [Pseudomonas sp. ZM23]|uniref:Chaperone NapD n=2 Tax=Pseudomonas triclosanedens TaxID=2961893 RepID=A0ABY7A3L0_9PSED|nr:chaperone NapD [Pseudomonas triclosanedens]MCP8470318.1 chaperone NapD [Pseudomonas triclosanedens]MCP8476123.1 chaperone NapD [Pseudomonas triclosanedens]WAI51644.1 chaperone NapD [Pseudomonas triclosanedens]